MKYPSAKGPIIVGSLLVFILIGVAVLATLNKNIVSLVTTPTATTTPVTNQTYTFQNVTLQYPSTWTIKEDTYVNAAGNGGVVGATFIPPQQKNAADKIGIGGQQVTCETFNTDQINCKMVSNLPIYTGSKNPDILATFNTMVQTASSTPQLWITNTNEMFKYKIDFQSGMTVKDNQAYPSEPSSGATSTVFLFPKAFFTGSTYVPDSLISVTKIAGTCADWVASQPLINPDVVSTKKVGPLTFELRTWGDNGAGNHYVTEEYSAEKNNSCYLVTLFAHNTSPGNVGESPDVIAALAAKNTEIKKSMEVVFDHMVSSFALIK